MREQVRRYEVRQVRVLQDLSSQFQNAANSDEELKMKVNTHYNQISAQISRLKLLKDNLLVTSANLPTEIARSDKNERPQAFDLFSPIPVIEDKHSKVTDELKNQPRVLSMDSGNFSVVSKHTASQNLLTMSGDALKPIVVHATSDSISAVPMKDISTWYNETESLPPDKQIHQSYQALAAQGVQSQADSTSQSISATEQRFAADIRSVATSNDKMKELNADIDTVLDRLQQILTHNFTVDESCFDNTQLRETANEMEGLLGSLIRGVEQRATLNATKGLV